MKLKVLKNHHWPPDWDFVANDTKNLAQKESRVRLPDQGWQRKLIWLPLEPVSKGSWPHYALCLLWKSPDSTAYSARKGPGLQSRLVSSGLQGTEEPTNRAKTERSFIILQSNQSGNRGSFAIEARAPQRHWGPDSLHLSVCFTQTLGFVLRLFLGWWQNGCLSSSEFCLHRVTPKCRWKTDFPCISFYLGGRPFSKCPCWMAFRSLTWDLRPCSVPSWRGGEQYWLFSCLSLSPVKVWQQDRCGGWAGSRNSCGVQLGGQPAVSLVAS